jgi:dihydrofolate synthase / folylpolyglutamate synthase
MNYQQTIDYLYQQLPMFSRIGAAAYKEDLHNSIALCNSIGNPQNKIKTIHIAGTNGKGSTSHMLAAILQQAGYKTGLYTSPHIKDFRERIKINGQMIDKDFVVNFVANTKQISLQIQPSFFELTMVMAFDYFATQKVDVAIIETGLGGRLDSTNIITPILSVITNIGYDHMNILGNTLQAIAAEKAGIIKKNIPVVVGEYLPETKNIFIQKAAETASSISFAQEQYHINHITNTHTTLSCTIYNNDKSYNQNFELDLNGAYQINNLRTVICAVNNLQQIGFSITNEKIKNALANVKKLTGLYGRWDVLAQHPLIICDVAHNQDGIKQIVNQLLNTINEHKIHFVVGMVADKDVSKVLQLLPQKSNYYFTNAHIPRALPHLQLKEFAASINILGNSFDDVNMAIQNAKQNAAIDDIIMICGSFFVIAEIDENLFTTP